MSDQSERIYLSSPHMGGTERELVQEAFDLNWIAPVGPHINQFESILSEYIEGLPSAALASGTAAMHLALRILGVKTGDNVICQSFTFAGSANPIKYEGANPVFIDSESDTWNMDPVLLKKAIEEGMDRGKKPAAIIYVHLYGMPAKVEEIAGIAKNFGIPLIEDAAEALGTTYNGKKAGSFGDISILSFNGNKIITTSGGGALLSANEGYVEKAKYLATQARQPAAHYEHIDLGFNYRLSNVCAAIGIGQMNVLDERVKQKRSIFERYKQLFAGHKNVSFLEEPEGCYSNRWLTCALFDDLKMKEAIVQAFSEDNIECRPLWKPMHMQSLYKNEKVYDNRVSESLFNNGLCLPSGTNMTEAHWQRIENCIRSLKS